MEMTGSVSSSGRTLRATLAAAAFAIVMLVGSQRAGAATVTTCEPFGTVSIAGNSYIYQQNEWNSTATQCASVDNVTGAFSMTTANFNLGTAGPPATYPSIFRGCHWGTCTTGSGMPIQVSGLGSATSSWSTTQPASGAYDVAFDLWTNTTPTTAGQPNGSEIMIWLNSRGGVQPFGSRPASGVSLAGRSWDVWTGRQSSWNIISYVLVPGATSFTNLDVAALIRDSVTRGSTSASWYLIDAEAGFEIWQGGQGLATNSFSFSATSGGGGGGGSDTQAPSAPANLRTTATTSTSASLAWNAATDNVGVTGYDVLRAPGGSGGTFAVVGTSTTTSFTNTGLAASTTYRYQARARDAAGNLSAVSNTITVTTPAAGGGGGGGTGGCTAAYRIVNQWPGGFQAEVTVTNG